MPSIPSANTAATVYAIAERAAEMSADSRRSAVLVELPEIKPAGQDNQC
jgi:choline dehydrogenase-like flavoprotein